jgi:hypothetical protein
VELKSVFLKLKPNKKPEVETKEKPEKKPQTQPKPTESPATEEKNEHQPQEEKPQPQPIKEYHETIYTKGTKPKEKKPQKQTKPDTSWKPTHWEGITTIEKNVDTIHTKSKYPKPNTSCTKDMDIEKKVDILLKKKQK